MDGSHFDDLARSFATSVSRRKFISGLAAGALGLAGLRGASGTSCRATGEVCREDANCCSGSCGAKDRNGRRTCACPSGTTVCNGKCVNPKSAFQSDSANCGSCGNTCPRTTCHIGVCSGGVCGLAPDPKAVGTSCDDGNACTLNDVCRADGSCAGTPVTCTARDQCHDVGTCDPATGRCSNPDKPDGTACDDGNACTQTDMCQGGVCVGSNSVVCQASDQCHVDGVCDPKMGTCSSPKKANGSACNDGNPCTRTDTCQDGLCVGSDPVVCDPPDQCHEPGVCNPATGTCTYQPKADNTPCDDEDMCTIGDTCQAGVCTPGASKTCYASDQCHDVGTCDPGTGECGNPAKLDGTICDDGDACTQTDTCQSSVCVGANPVTCIAQDQCHEAGSCDPETGLCSNPVKRNGAPCSDDNACTLTDTCQDGVCTPETDVVCEPPSNPCQEAGICNHATGQCEYANKQNGSACTSGDKMSTQRNLHRRRLWWRFRGQLRRQQPLHDQ